MINISLLDSTQNKMSVIQTLQVETYYCPFDCESDMQICVLSTEVMIETIIIITDLAEKCSRTEPRTDPCVNPNGRCCGPHSV